MDNVKLGTNIRRIRKEKGMSQVQLACKIFKANTYICDIEMNRAIPSLKTLIKIADALEVTVPELFQ